MSRNLKVLGLSLVAVLAMSAMVAAGASAEAPFKFKSEGSPTTLTGKQHAANDVFTTHTGTVSCDNATYAGTQTGTETSEVSVTPSYSGCKAFGLLSVPIDVNGCSYRFNANTKVGVNYEGSVDVVCPAGKQIEVTAPGCTVTVKPQTGLSKVTYTNVGAGATREVTVDVNINNLQYEEHRPLFGICSTNTVPTTGGTYVGAGLVTGSSGVNHTGIFVG